MPWPSSRMWEPLLTRLGATFHLVAPDYPGFGHSDTPDPAGFAYTFDHLAEVIDGFIAKLGLTRYVLFLQDYGGPIGFRLALAHPDRVLALIVQNAVAHEDGLGPLREARRHVAVSRSAAQPLDDLGGPRVIIVRIQRPYFASTSRRPRTRTVVASLVRAADARRPGPDASPRRRRQARCR